MTEFSKQNFKPQSSTTSGKESLELSSPKFRDLNLPKGAIDPSSEESPAIKSKYITTQFIQQRGEVNTQKILESMPLNSAQNCVGISHAMEQILQGNFSTDARSMSSADLSKKIYSNILEGKVLDVPSHVVMANGATAPIDSKEVLTEISIQVANQYKNDFIRLESKIGPEAFRTNLTENPQLKIGSKNELDSIIESDKDHISSVIGMGTRQFPDGTKKASTHMFIIEKQNDKYVVYDPNDPGSPKSATVTEYPGQGLWVSWSSTYKETGMKTAQGYFIGPVGKYFQKFNELQNR